MNHAAVAAPADADAARVGAAAVLEALPLAVVVLDALNRFVFANSAAEEFFTVGSRQLQATHLTDFVPESCSVANAVAQVRRTNATLVLHDVTLESPRLARLGVDATLAPLPEVEGGVVLGLTAARKPGDGEAEAPSRALAGMAAVLAHEVKNPLSGIRGAAQLLEASLDGEEREFAILIRGEVDRIRSLVDRVALLGDGSSAKGAVDIHDVLEHVRRLAARGFASRIRLREAYDPSLPQAVGNRDQLVQVLLNLVKNAAEAIGEENGEIVLTSAFHPGVWRIAAGARRHLPIVVAVRDNGPGIPEALRASLFQPCVSKKPAGSGLGLALVGKIVDEHGGLIDVESRPGRTEFRLHLPMAKSTEER